MLRTKRAADRACTTVVIEASHIVHVTFFTKKSCGGIEIAQLSIALGEDHAT